MTPGLLEVENLRVEIPTRKGVLVAVDDLSFRIDEGEVLGVVGESGAGKSLTGMAVLGLLAHPARIAAGQIRLSGQRIDDLSEEELTAIRGTEIGAIFQDPLTSLNPLFTIGDQLVETIRLHGRVGTQKARERAIELLADVGISAPDTRLGQYPHHFSGGMRQRVVIALALSARPRLVIADEPTTALDVSIQAQIVALLKRLCAEQGTAVMLITHDMGVIAEAAGRVLVMYAGRAAETGPARDVLRHPRHPYTVGLLGALPGVQTRQKRLQQIPGAMPRLSAIPSGCAFHPRCPEVFGTCSRDQPPPFVISQCKVACWLYSEDARGRA